MNASRVFTKIGLVFGVAAVCGATLAMATEAGAAWRKDHPSLCSPANFAITDLASPLDTGFLTNSSTSGLGNFKCPIENSSSMPINTVNTLGINVFDAHPNGSFAVRACTSGGGSGGFWACGTWAESSVAGTGSALLQPGLWAWQTYPDNNPFLEGWIPTKYNSSYSYLRGWFIDNQ